MIKLHETCRASHNNSVNKRIVKGYTLQIMQKICTNQKGFGQGIGATNAQNQVNAQNHGETITMAPVQSNSKLCKCLVFRPRFKSFRLISSVQQAEHSTVSARHHITPIAIAHCFYSCFYSWNNWVSSARSVEWWRHRASTPKTEVRCKQVPHGEDTCVRTVHADCETDALIDRQPVQLVTNVIWNMIKLEFLQNQSGSGMQDVLQLIQ